MRIPLASYRIQFEPKFGFRQGESIVSYLKELGISDLYASPIFEARPGSEHGYDVVDPRKLNPELGNEKDFLALAKKVKLEEMGWLQDIVPNHMAFDARNPFLADVLENGPNSQYYNYFDIDWRHYYETIRGKVLIPFLGSFYGAALENQEIRLDFDNNGFFVSYGPLCFPVRLESYASIIAAPLEILRQELGEEHPDFIRCLGVLYILEMLQAEPAGKERQDKIKFVKHTLAELTDQNKIIRQAFDKALDSYNGRKGEPESFNALENLLAEQWFRLSFWKVASEEINYRRFFFINDLISLNICRKEVFDDTHQFIFELLEKGFITGLRVDHIDSISEIALYLKRLKQRAGDSVYIVAEKILGLEEDLPAWPIQGTTGYDFLTAVTGVFCQKSTEKTFTRFYRSFTGVREEYEDLLWAKKRLMAEKHMFGDINNLAHRLKNLSSQHRYGSDITMDSLKRALSEIMVSYSVYRTYLGTEKNREADHRYIRTAVESARKKNPALLHELNFIENILLLHFDENLGEEDRAKYRQFVIRFQQFTGPLMAKGFEDTLLYVFNRLLSLNEVGGQPERFGIELEEFHDFNLKRKNQWPHSMNATATHDTKRGEDVRARLNVLSEIPAEWGRSIRNWNRINRQHKRVKNRRKIPDKNDEYFFYQTLVGSFPVEEDHFEDFIRRIKEYLIKAVREAKVHTGWLKPDTMYEEGYMHFVESVLQPGEDNPFWQEFKPFQRKIASYGVFNSLGQTLAKITAPGVPDFYQGCEFWDLSMVDPDNRRPVDYNERQKALKTIQTEAKTNILKLIQHLLHTPQNGWIKMFLILRALQVRKRAVDLFEKGEYRPVFVTGRHKSRVLVYERHLKGQRALIVIPRFLTGLIEEGEMPFGKEVWQDTCLELEREGGEVWENALTGQKLEGHRQWPIGLILTHFPLALLTNFKM